MRNTLSYTVAILLTISTVHASLYNMFHQHPNNPIHLAANYPSDPDQQGYSQNEANNDVLTETHVGFLADQ